MKWKSFLVAFAVAAASLASATSAAAAAIISIVPSSTGVSVGDTFTLEVRIDVPDNTAGYSFSVAFDPTILSVVSVEDEIGTFYEGANQGEFFQKSTDIDNVAGTVKEVSAILFQPNPGVSGSGILAFITFNALGAGVSAVTPYFDMTVVPALDGLFAPDLFELIDTSFVPGQVTVRGTTPPVPEPASVLTLSLGLGTALARRRRQNRPTTIR